jgi:hypothetical protein
MGLACERNGSDCGYATEHLFPVIPALSRNPASPSHWAEKSLFAAQTRAGWMPGQARHDEEKGSGPESKTGRRLDGQQYGTDYEGSLPSNRRQPFGPCTVFSRKSPTVAKHYQTTVTL